MNREWSAQFRFISLMLIALLIIWSAVDITRESMNILLEGMPRGIGMRDLMQALKEVPGVIDVHDVHVWTLGADAHALSCHAVIADMPTSSSGLILREMNEVLLRKYHIHHTTIQFEHSECAGCAAPDCGRRDFRFWLERGARSVTVYRCEGGKVRDRGP